MPSSARFDLVTALAWWLGSGVVQVSGILFLLMLAGAGGVFLTAAIVAFRGRRYWATWLMLTGTVFLLLGSVSFGVGQYFWVRSVSHSHFSSGAAASRSWMEALMFGGLLAPLGMILFAAGLISVCSRFGGLEKRAAELEIFNRQLQDRLRE